MKKGNIKSNTLLAAAIAVLIGGSGAVNATEPCGDFGECKTLIELNTTDGDIGFHFLGDGDDLIRMVLFDPNHKKIYKSKAGGPLAEQFFTESFVESAEPLCFDPMTDDDEENDDEDFVTLEEFLDRWEEGTYHFVGIGDGWELSFGATTLGFDIPAAPAEVDYDDETRLISWEAGDDLGECATAEELDDLVMYGILPEHPEDVDVAAWEVVFEPDVEDGDPVGALKYTVRVAGDIEDMEVTVAEDYLDSLPDDTLVKIEIGAIGTGDNASFTEIFDICVNEEEGCEEEDEDE